MLPKKKILLTKESEIYEIEERLASSDV